MSVRDWAKRYIELGWKVVVLAPGEKNAVESVWRELEYTPDMFRPGDNIGIKSMDGMVIVDLDCPEAVSAAPFFLPQTGAVYGRPSKPRSKWIYRCHGLKRIVEFKDTKLKNKKGATLLELRVNHQDMAPPSKHPDGEELSWDGKIKQPSSIEPPELWLAGKLIATASLLIRYYNGKGNRHKWMMAVAGSLRHYGVSEEDALKLIRCATKAAGDPNPEDRYREVRSTYAKSKDEAIAGETSLQEQAEEHTLLASLQQIWGANQFKTNDKKKIVPNSQENILLALQRLDVQLSYNRFARRMHVQYEDYDGILDDDIGLRLWFDIDKKFKFRPSKQFFLDMLMYRATMSTFNPVINYLRSLKWDRKERLEEWLIITAGVEDTAYTRAVSKLPLLGAVRRIMQPGCLFHEMLILESSTQGLLKSSLIRELCPNEEWYSDDLPLNVDSKKLVEQTAGKWIIEASDLSGFRRSQIEQLKSMMARQIDGPVRHAYARIPKEQPRQFILIGTTNAYTYLVDPTGNRRFWPVRVQRRCNIQWMAKNRDQLWAEAFHREQAGESIRLKEELYAAAEKEQESRRVGDPWEALIDTQFSEHYQRISSDEVWEALGIAIDRRDQTAAHRVAAVMQKLGFERKTVRKVRYDQKGNRINTPAKGWARGEKLLKEE